MSSNPLPRRVLEPPGFHPLTLLAKAADLRHHGDLLLTLSLHRIRVRYKQSALGLGWAIAQPLALMLIYTVIFSVVTRVPTQGMPYSIFVFAALLPWTFFSGSLTGASTSLVSHSYLITKVFFPREILPLTYQIAGVFDFLVGCTVLVALMAYYRVAPTAGILWVIPIMAVAFLFSAGLSLLLAAFQVSFRDIGLALPLLLQIWMFASPVVYSLETVPARFRGFYILNPMAGVVENFRRVVLAGQEPEFQSLATGAAVTAVLLPVAYGYFKHREATMADVI